MEGANIVLNVCVSFPWSKLSQHCDELCMHLPPASPGHVGHVHPGVGLFSTIRFQHNQELRPWN